MIKLFTINSEKKSAKKLGFPTFTSFGEQYAQDLDNDIVIRWGNSGRYYLSPDNVVIADFKNVINSAAKIRTNCDKSFALAQMSRVVHTPRVFHDVIPSGITAVIRPDEHTGGKDFQVQAGPYDLPDGYHALEFIKTDKEFRVWFCGNDMFACRRVALNDKHRKQAPCRAEWGYSYLNSVPPRLRKETAAAARVIGLEVGAADVLWDGTNYYFLELNSAPSIDTNTLIRFYSEGLKRLAQKKFPKLMQA